MQPAADHISIREKICYGLGDSSANIFFGMTMMFLPYFYTDVVGLTASAMGALFLIARLVDAFSDPIIGNFADRHETKHGHYRPFLLYLAIPYGLSCFLVFFGSRLIVYREIDLRLCNLYFLDPDVCQHRRTLCRPAIGLDR